MTPRQRKREREQVDVRDVARVLGVSPEMARHLPMPRQPKFWPIAVFTLVWALASAVLWWELGLPLGFGWLLLRSLVNVLIGVLLVRLRWHYWSKQNPIPSGSELRREMFERWAEANRRKAHLN